jgi:hypothetical protein
MLTTANATVNLLQYAGLSEDVTSSMSQSFFLGLREKKKTGSVRLPGQSIEIRIDFAGLYEYIRQ